MSSNSSTSSSKALATGSSPPADVKGSDGGQAAHGGHGAHAHCGVVFNALERLPARKLPWAAIVFALAVVLIETGLYANRIWFADRAAWQWEVKKQMLAQNQLNGDIALMGTSVLFHGLDAVRINAITGDKPRVVNLALNGMQMHHIAQTLEDELQNGNHYDRVLIELRDVDLVRENWVGGPYWRLWASWGDLVESRIPIHEPSLVVPFAANRILTSFNYRQGLDNWLTASAKARRPTAEYRQRNHEVGQFMQDHLGYSEGEFQTNMASASWPAPKTRLFAPNAQGSYWFEKLLTLCERYNVRVTLLVPPAPPNVIRDRAASAYDANLDAYIAAAQKKHATLAIEVLRFPGYEMVDFADDHHYSPQGTTRLTQDVARWASELAK